MVSLETPLAFSLEHVSVDRGGRTVVHDVDLECRAGEWLGVIGPNGSGKSTLLRAVAGILEHEGRVALADGRHPRPTDVALMAQSPTLPPGMTVIEYVLLGRTAHLRWLQGESRRDREIAVSVLRRLELVGFAERFVDSLSGGEAQRVVVARALAQQAPVLLLDEPTSALDLGHQVEVLELLDELRRRDGLTIVAALHDLGAAARHADRLLLLSQGRVAGLGEPRRVLDAALLSEIYGTSLVVHELDGQLLVVPAAAEQPAPTGARGALARNQPGRTRDEAVRSPR